MATVKKEQAVFTKEQLVKSIKYIRHVDFLDGNLQDGKMYTFEEVDKLILDFYRKDKGEKKC